MNNNQITTVETLEAEVEAIKLNCFTKISMLIRNYFNYFNCFCESSCNKN